MMKQIFSALLAIFIAIICAAAILIYQNTQNTDSYNWRYKMTVTVETPEGVKSGSAVRKITIVKKRTGQEFTDKKHYVFDESVKGEAVVVDLGDRGVLFALTDWTDYVDVMNAFNIQKYDEVEALPVGSQSELDPLKYPGGPKMVTFTDMDDSKTVKLAMAWPRKKKCDDDICYAVTDNMEEIFGEGVKLKSIIIEKTDEPVTWGGLEKHLVWLKEISGGYLHGGFTSKDAPLGLHGGNFKRKK